MQEIFHRFPYQDVKVTDFHEIELFKNKDGSSC